MRTHYLPGCLLGGGESGRGTCKEQGKETRGEEGEEGEGEGGEEEEEEGEEEKTGREVEVEEFFFILLSIEEGIGNDFFVLSTSSPCSRFSHLGAKNNRSFTQREARALFNCTRERDRAEKENDGTMADLTVKSQAVTVSNHHCRRSWTTSTTPSTALLRRPCLLLRRRPLPSPPCATLTTFAITPPGGGGDSDGDDDDSDSVVECPTIRAALRPRPSPFVMTNYYGGGFASDDDRVALSSIRFASPSSANASCQGFYAAPSSSLVEEQQKKKKKQKSASSGSGSSSATLRGEIGGDGLFESGYDAVCIPLPPWAIRAGARQTVYFDGRKVTVGFSDVFFISDREKRRKRRWQKQNSTFFSSLQKKKKKKAAIVTCGGLCPGLNDVVQSLTQKLAGGYGVKNIVGVRYGLKGFYDKTRKSVKLTPAAVEGIQLQGGTILGTSRGGADIAKIVQAISRQAIDMVFVVGGNGGNAAAAAIHEGKKRVGYILFFLFFGVSRSRSEESVRNSPSNSLSFFSLF